MILAASNVAGETDVHENTVEDTVEDAHEKQQEVHENTVVVTVEEAHEKQQDVHENTVEDTVEEAHDKQQDVHENTVEDTVEALEKQQVPSVPKPKGLKGQCPLFCSPGKEYANIYKHMKQKHKTTYTQATATIKRKAMPCESESESDNEAQTAPMECMFQKDTSSDSEYVPEEERKKRNRSPDPPLTPELLKKKKPSQKLVNICREKTPKKSLHSKIADHDLSQEINLELLSGLERYLKELSGNKQKTSLSNHSREVIQTVAKFMFFAGCRSAANMTLLVDRKKVQAWIEAYEEVGVGSSSLYNKILYLRKARRYAVANGIITQVPQDFQVWEEDKLRILGSQKKHRQMIIKENLSEEGALPDLKEVYEKTINDTSVMLDFTAAIEKARKGCPLTNAEYLHIMRVSLMALILGNMHRPMAAYSLTVGMMKDIDWSQDIVVIRNPNHKTPATGSAKILLSGHLKKCVHPYASVVRPRLPNFSGDKSPFIVNSMGKALNSSSVTQNIEALQNCAGVTGVRTGHLRKSASTFLNKNTSRRAVSATLNHSEAMDADVYDHNLTLTQHAKNVHCKLVREITGSDDL